MTDQESVRVVGIPGSLRDGSFTVRTVEIALEGARRAGAQTELVDLRDLDLPILDGGVEDEEHPPDVFRMREAVQAADGIVLGTPEYHGSYSGVLKNALDLMGFDEFEDKMIGLVGVSGGRMGANTAMNHLREVGRALHAWVVPTQAGVARAWKAFEEGELADEGLADRIRAVGAEVTRYAKLHNVQHAEAFLDAWAHAQPNPGGEDR